MIDSIPSSWSASRKLSRKRAYQRALPPQSSAKAFNVIKLPTTISPLRKSPLRSFRTFRLTSIVLPSLYFRFPSRALMSSTRMGLFYGWWIVAVTSVPSP